MNLINIFITTDSYVKRLQEKSIQIEQGAISVNTRGPTGVYTASCTEDLSVTLYPLMMVGSRLTC